MAELRSHWPGYPPMYWWPTLMGLDADKVVAIIKKERPDFEVHKVKQNAPVWANWDSKRVRVYYDSNNKVTQIPETM